MKPRLGVGFKGKRLFYAILVISSCVALLSCATTSTSKKADVKTVQFKRPIDEMNIKELRTAASQVAKVAPKFMKNQDVPNYIISMEHAIQIYDEATEILCNVGDPRSKGRNDYLYAYTSIPSARLWSAQYCEYSSCMYNRSLALKYMAHAYLVLGNRQEFDQAIQRALEGLKEMVEYRQGHYDIETHLEMCELLLLQNKVNEAAEHLEGIDQEFSKLDAISEREADARSADDLVREEQAQFDRWQILGISSTEDNLQVLYRGLRVELAYRTGDYRGACQIASGASSKDLAKSVEDAYAKVLVTAVSPIFMLPNIADYLTGKALGKASWNIKQSDLGDKFYTFGFDWMNAPLHLVNSEKDIVAFRGDVQFIQNLKPRWFAALAAYRLNDLDTAKKNLDKILASEGTLASTDPAIWWTSCYHMGLILEKENRYEEARSCYAKAIDIIENLRNSLLTDQLKLGFTENKNLPYDGAVRTSLALNDAEAGFVYSERARSRALLDLLANKETGETIVAPPTVASPDMEEAAVTAPGEMFPLPLERLPESMFQTRSLPNEMTVESSKEAELNSILGAECLTAQAVQEFLKQEDSLIEYFVGEDQVAIFVLNKDGVTAETVQKGAKEVQEAVDTFRRDLLSGSAAFRASSNRLYQMIFAPIEKHIHTNVIIVPHLQLHKVPFAALMGNDSHYLVESKVISTIYSGSTLKYLDGKGGKALDRIIAFANPAQNVASMLPSTEQEVAAISPLFAESKVLIGDKATKAMYLSSAKGYDVIHFACHGKFYPDNPSKSCLLLADDGSQGGMLTAGDIYKSDITGCSLVTLSACETGLSKETSGDDALGLGRALIYAGAPRLIVSLWSVADEATAGLMKEFYTNLKQGRSASQSLRDAQLAMLHRAGDSTITRGIATVAQQTNPTSTPIAATTDRAIPSDHPFFWAPFVVLGDCK